MHTSKFALCLLAASMLGAAARADGPKYDQSSLVPTLNAGTNTLSFDWPTLQIGTGEYEEGPTGVTVIRFAKRAHGAVDVRGGGPGTVNTDYLRIGYEIPELDAVVFSGGSFYGLESTTAVNTALKDDGIRDGNWDNIGFTVGAIIYDLGDRRLNEIYPDKRLAQAAYRAVQPGVFPLGAHGAGRLAKTGGLFGCNAFSGQGAAFRQIGPLKIAAFVVVNALGVVTKRDGTIAACYPDASWPRNLHTVDLLSNYPASRKPNWGAAAASDGKANEDKKRNTTISLIVTNQKLPRAQLERLATHVHSSMARAIQPFATEFDGDVLYAVSTAELDRAVDESETPNIDLDVIAADVMWDAILSSVPEQPAAPKRPARLALKADELRAFAGDYVFSPFVTVRITMEGEALNRRAARSDGSAAPLQLRAQATGLRSAYAIGRDTAVELQPLSTTQFTVPGRYPLVLDFSKPDVLVMNPGHWQQTGSRQKASP
jgi:L-aminopeptidase/D-esterase-like protein